MVTLILTAPEIGLEKRALAVLTELHVWKRPWFHNKSCNLACQEPGNLVDWVGGLCEVIENVQEVSFNWLDGCLVS